MSEYGVKNDTLELSFVDFIKMCGLNSRPINREMHNRISSSLFKLASVTLKFQGETKGLTTHLVQSALYDINMLWRSKLKPGCLNHIVWFRQLLLRLKAIDAMKRKESAQATPILKVFRLILPPFP